MISRLTVLAAIVLVIAACGDDSEAATSTTGPMPGTTTTADTGTTMAPDGAPGGSVTIGDTTWAFDPTIQCGFFPGGVISIAGNAAGDPEVEIVFDAFGEGDLELSVSGPDFLWRAGGADAFSDIETSASSISGTATVSATNGTTAEAEFAFTC